MTSRPITRGARRVGPALGSATRAAHASAARGLAQASRWPRRLGPRGRASLIGGAVVLVLAVALGVFLYLGPLLRVETVEIIGVSEPHSAVVRSAAAIPTGQPLLQVDAHGAEERVRRTGLVTAVTVRRRWPSTIVVETEPRVPVVVVTGLDGPGETPGRYVDAEGIAFDDAPARSPGVPVARLARPEDPASRRTAAALVGALTGEQASRVDNLVVGGDARARFWLGNVLVAWGGPDDGRVKATVLAGLADQPGVRYVDVSVPLSPVTSKRAPALPGPADPSGAAPSGGRETPAPTRADPGGTRRSPAPTPGEPASSRTGASRPRADVSSGGSPTSTKDAPARRQ